MKITMNAGMEFIRILHIIFRTVRLVCNGSTEPRCGLSPAGMWLPISPTAADATPGSDWTTGGLDNKSRGYSTLGAVIFFLEA